jgi:hypothetical protein
MIKSCAYLHEWFDLLEHNMCVCMFGNIFSKNHVEMEKTFSHAEISCLKSIDFRYPSMQIGEEFWQSFLNSAFEIFISK